MITYLTSTHNVVSQASSTMSCGAPLLPERVSQVVDERKKAEKRVGELEGELAEHIGKTLLTDAASQTSGGAYSATYYHRTDDSSNPLGFLSSIAAVIGNKAEELLPSRPYFFVLSSSPSTQTQNSISTVLVVGSDDKVVKQAGDALKGKLGVKGGGKGPRWSGKFIGVWKAAREGVAIAEIIGDIQSQPE